jgi:hypothetical protein
MTTRSEEHASDKLSAPAEAPSRLQQHHSLGRKAKYKQIKVNIGFQQNGQEAYIFEESCRTLRASQLLSPDTSGCRPVRVRSWDSPASSWLCDVSRSVTFRLMLRLQIPRSYCGQATCKKCDVVPVISGIQRMRTQPLLSAPRIHRIGGGASATATEVQLTVANRNYLHQLASSCTKLRNLHQKIFCQKNKIWRRVPSLVIPSLTLPRSITSLVPPFSQFSSSKVGRHSLGSTPPSAPNVNTAPSEGRARPPGSPLPSGPAAEPQFSGPASPGLKWKPSPCLGLWPSAEARLERSLT